MTKTWIKSGGRTFQLFFRERPHSSPSSFLAIPLWAVMLQLTQTRVNLALLLLWWSCYCCCCCCCWWWWWWWWRVFKCPKKIGKAKGLKRVINSLRSKHFCSVFRAPEPISEFRMRGKWSESKTLLSPHFPRNQTSENAEDPTETLATQARLSVLIIATLFYEILVHGRWLTAQQKWLSRNSNRLPTMAPAGSGCECSKQTWFCMEVEFVAISCPASCLSPGYGSFKQFSNSKYKLCCFLFLSIMFYL